MGLVLLACYLRKVFGKSQYWEITICMQHLIRLALVIPFTKLVGYDIQYTMSVTCI